MNTEVISVRICSEAVLITSIIQLLQEKMVFWLAVCCDTKCQKQISDFCYSLVNRFEVELTF